MYIPVAWKLRLLQKAEPSPHVSRSPPGRQDKQLSELLALRVNQDRHRLIIEIIEPATNQRKSLAGKIDHWRCKIELHIKPRFYSVLIGRSDVGEVVCHQRPHMTGDELRC